MKTKRFDIYLQVKNNTTSDINISLLGTGTVSGFLNSSRQFSWDITSELYLGTNVSIQVKLNGAASYDTYSARLITINADGIIQALNTLGIGTFWKSIAGGNTYVVSANDKYMYGALTTNSAAAPTFLFITDSLIAKLTITCINPVNGVVNWGDGVSETFSSGDGSASTPVFEVFHLYGSAVSHSVMIALGNTDNSSINTYVRGINLVGAVPGVLMNVTDLSSINNFTSLTSLLIQNNTVSASDINAALIALDATGVLNGTFNSSGQTPAAPPSGAGAVAKTSLQGKGWTVTTD